MSVLGSVLFLFWDKIDESYKIKINFVKDRNIKINIIEIISQWILKFSKQKICITKFFIIFYF